MADDLAVEAGSLLSLLTGVVNLSAMLHSVEVGTKAARRASGRPSPWRRPLAAQVTHQWHASTHVLNHNMHERIP